MQMISFLGLSPSEEGVKPEPTKLEAILMWELPEHRSSIALKFLTLAIHYISFTPKLVAIAAYLSGWFKQAKQITWI